MPIRTNEFQQLSRVLMEQFAPTGAKVTESAMVKTIHGDYEKEVDILIEANLNISNLKIGIECRDHNRKQCALWIRELYGKYQNLPIEKVIAVSSSGFSKTAIKEAKELKIELMTIQKALTTDWPKHFLELSLVTIETTNVLEEVVLSLNSEEKIELTSETEIFLVSKSTEKSVTLKQLALYLMKKDVQKLIDQHLKSNIHNYIKTLDDVKKYMNFERGILFPNMFFIKVEEKKVGINKIAFIGKVLFNADETSMEHYFSDDNKFLISVGKYSEKQKPNTIVLVQSHSDLGKIHLEFLK